MSKKILLVVMAFLGISVFFYVMGQESTNMMDEKHIPPAEEKISISGLEFSLIESATKELRRHGSDVQGYQITLYQAEDRYEVYFGDPERPPYLRGASFRMSEFVVVFDKDGNFKDAHFVR